MAYQEAPGEGDGAGIYLSFPPTRGQTGANVRHIYGTCCALWRA